MSLYLQITSELRHNIQQGVYKPGDKLPTEKELAERFQVNRHTVRRAVELLKQEGHVRVDQGRGMFVATTAIRYPIGKRVRYNETLKAQGWDASFQRLRALILPADPAVARELQIRVGEAVVLMERLGMADGQPISIGTSYFPHQWLPDLLPHLEVAPSISTLLHQRYGLDHLRYRTRVSARTVQPQDAALLGLPNNAPILLAESINCDQYGRLIEYGVTRFRGDRMELEFENDLSQLQPPDPFLSPDFPNSGQAP